MRLAHRITSFWALVAILICAPVEAQSVQRELPLWDAGPSTTVGANVLLGGTLAYQAAQLSHVRLAVELGAHLPIVRRGEIACYNSWGCSNPEPMAGPLSLATVGLRASVPLTERWYALADAAMVHGRWQYPAEGSYFSTARGIGLGRASANGRRSLELRWQRVGTTARPSNMLRLGWLSRW